MSKYFLVFIICVTSALSNIDIRRGGWLDRVIQYYKNNFYGDLKKAPVVKIKAKIERPPPGYVDSKQWDYVSVIRLLTLIRDSEDAADVRRAIRHSLKGSRRQMTYAETFKYFPSLGKDNPNYMYYAVDYEEYYADVPIEDLRLTLSDDDVIVVSNPVEAKLPSAKISVHLLKAILENRSKLARIMTTTVKKFSWLPINFTKPVVTEAHSTIPVVTEVAGLNDTAGPTTVVATAAG